MSASYKKKDPAEATACGLHNVEDVEDVDVENAHPCITVDQHSVARVLSGSQVGTAASQGWNSTTATKPLSQSDSHTVPKSKQSHSPNVTQSHGKRSEVTPTDN